MSIGESLPYRSPVSKLLRFFCCSRDKWKAKCKQAKRENKSLKYCLAKMTESRNRWKAEARDSKRSPPAEEVPVEEQPSKNRAGRPSRGRRGRSARPVVAAAR
jgi:hypothetical protein